jgi:hypothetical protein
MSTKTKKAARGKSAAAAPGIDLEIQMEVVKITSIGENHRVNRQSLDNLSR